MLHRDSSEFLGAATVNTDIRSRGSRQPARKQQPVPLHHLVDTRMMPMSEDGSNGYEAIASIYVAGRGTRPLVGDAIGVATVRAWAQAFPAGATVLDLGCGPGEPSTRILQEAGLATYAVDASAAMVTAFRERFPGVPIEHNTVEASEFFDRTFDGVLAWGLLFLLEPVAQTLVIEKVAGALNPEGVSSSRLPKSPSNGWTP